MPYASDWERGDMSHSHGSGPVDHDHDPTEPVTAAQFERRYTKAIAEKVAAQMSEFTYPGVGSSADDRLEQYLASRATDAEFEAKVDLAERYTRANWLGIPAGTVVRFPKVLGEQTYTFAGVWTGQAWYLTGRENRALSVNEFIAWLVKGNPVAPERVQVLGWDGRHTLESETPETVEDEPEQAPQAPADLAIPRSPAQSMMGTAYGVHSDEHEGSFALCMIPPCNRATSGERDEFVKSWWPDR